jgi:glycosyltransferase involved in cell wall biosynthesis
MRAALVGSHPHVSADGHVSGGSDRVRRFSALAAALAARGHDVTVYTRRAHADAPDRVVTDHGYEVVSVPSGPCAAMADDEELPLMGDVARFLDRQWQTTPPDVVHCDLWTYGLAAQLAARNHGIAAVQTFTELSHVLRSRQRRDAGSASRTRLETLLARNAAWVTAPCTEDIPEVARLARDRRKTSVLPGAVDVEQFDIDGESATRGSRPRIVAVARRFLPHKGLDVLIRALPRIPDAELLVIGGEDADAATEATRHRLLSLAGEVGVADRTVFTGEVPPGRVAPLLRSADVLVCPSWYEPHASPVVEAMSCGVPVIASSAGGMADAVIDEVTGVLVRAGDPRALASGIARVLSEGMLGIGMGLAGRTRAKARYSWDRIAAETETAYDHALAGRLVG